MRLILTVFLTLVCLTAHAVELNLVAIMGNKAMVEVDGSKPKLLAPGQLAGGAKLISVSSGAVIFDINGQKKTLTMDNRSFKNNSAHSSGGQKIILFADSGGHFFADITINGMPFRGMIDTGATSLAISSANARQASLDPTKGTPGHVNTAAGVVPYYRLSLTEVKFAGVVLYNVETGITMGNAPATPLIGMSVLNRFTMERNGDRLILTKRY